MPYGGAICRLKERIAEIWDKLDQKLHSINGVEGDEAGNVEIVSGDAAITISPSQVGHFVEIGLDHGNLPSAAVSSVNGQTGAVRLDAADIPGDGNLTVQQSIDLNKASINDCFDSLASEQLARQNADAALQTNINAVSANIPEISATPDPYKGVERDAQGRAFAADPASGATDKTLVTANWVSQTGDNSPNNILHRNGNETKIGILSIAGNDNYLREQYTNVDAYANPPSDITYDCIKQFDKNGLILYRLNGFRSNGNITCLQDDVYHNYKDENDAPHLIRFRHIYEIDATELRERLVLIKDDKVTKNAILNRWDIQ